MKATTVIVAFFIIQTKASFLDDFTGALTSVESAVSKLLNDVVTDVEKTMHCTILAMEKVLTISGAMKEPSGNIYKCYDQPDSKLPYKYKLPLDSLQVGDGSDNQKAKDINQQINSSIFKVNKSLNHFLDNGGHESLKHVKKKYTSRFTEVCRLLRQELEKISVRVDDKFQQFDSDKLSLESLWNDLKKLHEVEKNDKNISEVNEISQVLNEAVNALHLNTTNGIKSDEDKIGVIMQELEHETNSNVTYNVNIDRELSQWKEKQYKVQNYSSNKRISKEIPTNFKKVASKIFNDNYKSRKYIEGLTDISIRNQDKNLLIGKSQTTPDVQAGANVQADFTKKQEANFAEYYPLFDGVSTEGSVKAVHQANNIIKDNHRTETLFGLLAKKENVTDVFDSPELMDLFG